MTVEYEWDVEVIAGTQSKGYEQGEVIDHLYCRNFEEVKQYMNAASEPGEHYEAVLVRDDDAGREWAYLVDGKMPKFFKDSTGVEGSKVPERFASCSL